MSLMRKLKALIESGVTDYKELMRQTGASKAYVYKALHRYGVQTPQEQKTEAEIPKAEKPAFTFKAETVVPPPELAEAETPTLETIEEKVAEVTAKGFLTSEEITYLFESINELFGEEKRPKESCQLMGKVWEKPLNRLAEKYLDQNVDLYIALICTALWVAPVIKAKIEKRRKKKAEEHGESKGETPTKTS